MPVSQMNGKPLTWFSYADFSSTIRRTKVGGHISRATAERAVRKMRRNPIYGYMWIENTLGDRFEVV